MRENAHFNAYDAFCELDRGQKGFITAEDLHHILGKLAQTEAYELLKKVQIGDMRLRNFFLLLTPND